ncbi:MAG: type IV pilus assembly protein PilM [Sedimentisphaerales bacterium]|nr:type IV pilus assembly protein PilM [Sedimentisphaerales bacterium]
MAAVTGTVWAIDIGNNSLKALCMSTERGVAEVIGFENIQHGKILSGSNVTEDEKEELIALSLRELVTKYDLSMEEIVVSVPSQNSFVRFVNLPPVEAKRIPEMVKFEAVQQIPFGINEVQWDWQLMTGPDSPEIKVGLFAIKNEIVNAALNPLSREEIDASYVQIAPMALYNYLLYDRSDLFTSENEAVVIINVGAENTDLVVCTKSTVWQRCILLGGNNFTQAIADTFKLNFNKAEKLKRTAPMSKYARQVFQAMRPVFTDLASEVQRSLGFYNSANPNMRVKKIIAMGGGARLRGLLKYLQQTVQIPVERPDTFKKLAVSQGVSQAKFHENINDFGIVYGLALQGLGMGKIESNLLPRNIARSKEWATKGRYFIIAACLLLVVSVMSFGRTFWDKMQYGKHSSDRRTAKNIIDRHKTSKDDYYGIKKEIDNLKTSEENEFAVLDYRDIVMKVIETVNAALPNEKNNPKQAELYRAFARGDKAGVLAFNRNDRKQLFITNMVIRFTTDLENAKFQTIDFSQKDSSMSRSGDSSAQFDAERRRMEYETAKRLGETIDTETDSGFLITITGYSPYGETVADVRSLLDPSEVENDREKWGLINRLEHMDELFDVNCPFKLYDRIDQEHYVLNIEAVDTSTAVPVGTGEEKEKTYPSLSSRTTIQNISNSTLIDPLTGEPISVIVDENDKNKKYINDHWFILKMKFLWKDAPEPPAMNID